MPGVYTKVSSFAKFINKLKDKLTFQLSKVQNQTLENDNSKAKKQLLNFEDDSFNEDDEHSFLPILSS